MKRDVVDEYYDKDGNLVEVPINPLFRDLSNRWRKNSRFGVHAKGAILLTDHGVKDLTEKDFTPADWAVVKRIMKSFHE